MLLNERGILGKYLGRFADAERYYRRALAIRERYGGPGAAAILHNLGGLAHERGDPEEAYALARKGLAIREASDESDPMALAADRAALAAILVDLHRYDEAEALLAEALVAYRSWYGPRHYEVGVTLHNLGCHYRTIDGELRVFSSPHRYVWPAGLDLMAGLAGAKRSSAAGSSMVR